MDESDGASEIRIRGHPEVPPLKRDRIEPGDVGRFGLFVADRGQVGRAAIPRGRSGIAAMLMLKVESAMAPRVQWGRRGQWPATVNAEYTKRRLRMPYVHDVPTLDITRALPSVMTAKRVSYFDANQIRRVWRNECVLHGDLAEAARTHEWRQATDKKAQRNKSRRGGML
jgi:hypothetical protein